MKKIIFSRFEFWVSAVIGLMLAFVGFFFVNNKTFASAPMDCTGSGTYSSGFGNDLYMWRMAFPIVGNGQKLVKVSMPLARSGGSAPADSMFLSLRADSSSAPATTRIASSSLIAGSDLYDMGSDGSTYPSYDLTFADEPVLTASTTYWIVAERTNPTPAYHTDYYRFRQNISGGTCTAQSDVLRWRDDANAWLSGYFSPSVYVTFTLENATPPADTLTFSSSTITTDRDFVNWSMTFVNNGTSTKYLVPSVAFRVASSSAPNGFVYPWSYSSFNTFPQTYAYSTGTTAIYVPKNAPLFANTTYEVFGVLYSSDMSVYATSSVYSFSMGNATSTGYQPQDLINSPFSSSSLDLNATSSPFFVDCSMYDGPFFSSSTINGLTCGMKKASLGVVGFLVVPPVWVNDYLTSRFEGIKHSFPFSLVTNTIETMKTAVSQASSTPSLSMTISHAQYSATIPLMNTSVLDTTMGSSTKALAFQAVEWVLWVGVGVAILVTIL